MLGLGIGLSQAFGLRRTLVLVLVDANNQVLLNEQGEALIALITY
jgi:hypothetical protein